MAKHVRDVVAVLALVAVAVGVAGYILTHQRLRIPLLEDAPVHVWAELPTAQAVNPGQGQTVRVAGMRVGDIGEVKLEDGRALIRLDLDAEYHDLVRRDATALLRPRTGLKDMFLALDPGSSDQPVLPEGARIPVENTAPDVNADEILAALDRDSRDYLKLLISGAGKGLRGRGDDLREVFRRLGPLHRDVARLNRVVATRRKELARLVDNYGATISRLAEEDERLVRLVASSSRVFDRLAEEDAEISAAVARLPGALRQTEATLRRVRELGEEAGPAFEALRPAVRRIDSANRQLRPLAEEAEPIIRERIRPFVRTARPYLDQVRPAARDLGEASPDLREGFYGLNRLFNIAAYNPNGAEPVSGDPERDLAREEGFLFWLGWVAHNTTSLFSTSDAEGPYRRIMLMATCSTLLGLATYEPATEAIVGFSDVLNDPGLCPN